MTDIAGSTFTQPELVWRMGEVKLIPFDSLWRGQALEDFSNSIRQYPGPIRFRSMVQHAWAQLSFKLMITVLQTAAWYVGLQVR